MSKVTYPCKDHPLKTCPGTGSMYAIHCSACHGAMTGNVYLCPVHHHAHEMFMLLATLVFGPQSNTMGLPEYGSSVKRARVLLAELGAED